MKKVENERERERLSEKPTHLVLTTYRVLRGKAS